MSLAFSAFVLFILVAPGVLLRRTYLSQPFAKRFSATSATDEIVWAIVPALLLHAFALGCIRQLGYAVDFAALGHLLVGAKEDAALEAAFRSLDGHLRDIVVYNVLLWALAAGIGYGLRSIVISWRLDQRFQPFRFSNEWYYLLTGRGLTNEEDFDVVWVDALIGSGEASVIYSGALVGYYLSRDGGLESLWLTRVSKWVVAKADDTKPSEHPVARKQTHVEIEIPGEVFVVKYADVKNLNITYKSVELRPSPMPSDTVHVEDVATVEIGPPAVK